MEGGSRIAVDATGVYVAGSTNSINFPFTAGAFQTTRSGSLVNWEIFVSKLNLSGSSLLYSTYIGGNGDDMLADMALDAGGMVVFVATVPSDFGYNYDIAGSPYQGTTQGIVLSTDMAITKVNATGTGLVFSTYLRGPGQETAKGVAVDASGVYVLGFTQSGFPTTAGAYQTTPIGTNDMTVSKLSSNGSSLIYSTYLGGTGSEGGVCIRVDASGNAHIGGNADNTFPITAGSYAGGTNDGFITKLNSTGTALLFSSFIGSSGNDNVARFSLDASGDAYLSGFTGNTFLTTAGVVQPTLTDIGNAFLTKFSLVATPPPTITTFTPTSGPVGTVVTITGTNFTGATQVRFGGISAVTFNVDSPTQITATVPAGAVTGVVSVTTPGGTANSASNFTVTVPNIYYYGSGDPAIATNWRSNMGGMTGISASDFTTMGNIYIMETGKTGTLASADLTFGAGTTFTMQAGSTFNFGTRNLVLNGAINLGGQFVGNPTSTLTIGGSGTITGNLTFPGPASNQQLGGISINRASTVLTINSVLFVLGSGVNILSGSINSSFPGALHCSANSAFSPGTSFTGNIWVENGAVLSNNGIVSIPAGNGFTLVGNGTITGNAVTYLTATSVLAYQLTANRGSTDVEFPQTMNGQVFTNGAFTITYNNSKTVAGQFDHLNGAVIDMGATNTLTLNGSYVNSGIGAAFSGGTNRSLLIGGTGTFTGNLNFSGVQQLQNLTINRAGLTVPLGSPLTISGTLTLTNGIINANSNVLSISNPATMAISGGSATSYIQGFSLSRNMLPNISTDGTSYFYPIGDASNYRPLTLQNVRTGAGTPSATASLVAGTPSAGTGLTAPFADASRTWFVNALGPFTSSELLLSNLPTLAGTDRLGLGANAVGAYNRINSTPSGTSISSIGQITGGFGTTNQFIAIGTGAAATYTWSGGATGDWGIATNWTPNRTTPASDDRLEILNPATINVTNVPTETIGQLIFGGTGTKTLNGAGGVLTITGGTGDDFTSGAMTSTSLNNLSISLNAGTNLVIPVNSALGLTLNNTISGAGNLSIDGGFTTPHTEGLNGTSAATGAIRATGTVSYGTQMRLRTSSPNARLSAQGTKPAVNTLLDLQCDDNVALDKSLAVTGTLTLQGATSRMNIGANTLTINDFSNIGGAIIGSAASNLTITKTSGLTSPLAFAAGGQTLNNLSFTSPGGQAALATPLTIAGTLSMPDMTNGFSLGLQNLTLNDFSGLGNIGTGPSGDILTITKNGTVTSPLRIGPNLGTLILNGTNLECTLGSPCIVSNSLQLTSGILNSNITNTIILGPTTTITGGSTTSFVRGSIRRFLPSNISTDGTSYFFPVGDAGGYRPLNLNNVRTGAVSPVVRVTVAPSGATTPGMGTGINTPFAEGGRNWHVEQVSGNFNSATVELFANGLTADSRAARSTAQAGPYDRAGQTGGGASVVSDPGQTPGYFAIGTRALQTVLWTGGGMMGNWNDPANWTGGIVPSGADFQARFNGGTITLTSGLPMSLGSLIVEGGANVQLQQASMLNLTTNSAAIIVRGNSSLGLNGTSVVCAATATGSVEAGSTLTLGSSGLTLGMSGSLDIAGTLQRVSGVLSGGSATPVVLQNGSTLRYSGAGNVTTGAEFPATLLTGVTLIVQKTNATDVVTLNDSKNVQTLNLQQGRVAIPAGATFVINQNSTISANAGFDLTVTSVLELNNCALSNGNPTAGITGGINVQAASTLRLRDAASVTMNAAFYAAAASTLEFAGSTAKTTNLQELPATMTGTVVLNNGGGVTLDATPRTIQGGLTLTNGILTTPVALTLDQNAVLPLPGAASYIRTSGTGTFGRILPPNLVMSATPYLYPIGDASGYRPFTLTNVSTGVTPVTTALSTSPSGATSVGAGLQAPFVEMGRNWKFDVLSGTLSSAQITLQTASALNPALNRVGMSASGQAGSYDRTPPSGGTVAGFSITSDAVNFPAAPVTRHFAIANLATTFYYISGDPALAASWRTDAAGTGGTPLASDFTTSGRTFIIPTPRTATLATPLTFGAGVNFTMEAGTTLNGGSQALTLGGASNIAGTLNLDGTSTLVANATPVIQNGGTLRLVGNASAVTVNTPLYLSGSNLVYDNRTSAIGTELPLAPTVMQGNVQLGGIAGASTVSFNANTNIAGSFTMQGASQLAFGGTSTEMQLGGALALGSGTITGTGSPLLSINGSGAITGAFTVSPPNSLGILNFNRATRMTLGGNFTPKNLVLQGVLDARTNAATVRITGENPSALFQLGSGAVDGNLEWQLPANISTDGMSFPFLLTQGGSPRTLTLQNIRTGATAPVVRVRFDSAGAMTALINGGLSSVQPANWRVEVVSGDFLSSVIALNEATYQTTNRIGASPMQAGGYERVSSGAAQITSRLRFSPPSTLFFAIGTTSTNPVRYTLSPGSDPSVLANWADSSGRAANDFDTPNSEFVIPAGAPVRLGMDLLLGEGVSLIVRAGATLVIPDTRTLRTGFGGMLVEAGTPATMNQGGTVEVEGSGQITGGSAVYAGTTATLRYTGLGAKTALESEFPVNFGGSLTVNRGGTLTIASSRTVAGTLRLENGIIQIPQPSLITLTNPQPSAVQGGNTGAFISGSLQRSLLPNLRGESTVSYVFPVGVVNGSVRRFLPLTVIAPQSESTAPLLRVRGVAENPNGMMQTGLTALSQTEFWDVQLGSGSLSALVELGGVNFTAAKVVVTSATQSGTYVSARGSGAAPVLRSERIGFQNQTFFTTADGTLAQVQSVIPAVATVGGMIAINGTNLLSVQAVDFGGVQTRAIQGNASQLNIIVPQGAQTGALRLITPLGIITATEVFTVLGNPSISSIQPSEAAPGERITIVGANLTGAKVEFRAMPPSGSTQANMRIVGMIISNSTTEIIALIPQNATSGTIIISTPSGTVTSATVFRVLAPRTVPQDTMHTMPSMPQMPRTPVITGFSPAVADSGQIVTIRGAYLTATNGSTTVRLGHTSATILSSNDSTLTVRVPNNSASGQITVETPAGTVRSQTSFTTRQDSLRNAFGGFPQITALQPSSARVGDTLRIVGQHFLSVGSVRVGGGTATTFRIVSPTEIIVIVPPDASSGGIVLTHPAGSFASPMSIIFTLLPAQMRVFAPVISSFSRDSVYVGDTLTVRGANLVNLDIIRLSQGETFRMNVQRVISSSATVLTFIVPPIQPQPQDTLIPRLFTLFLRNDSGATSSNFGLRALWIIPSRLSTPPIVSAIDSARIRDSLALVGFFQATGGNTWVNGRGWRTVQPISSWYGVTLENNRVVRLELPNNNLRSRGLPAEIERLVALRVLNLSGNAIGDEQGLVRVLGLQSLEELQLANCNLSGRLDAVRPASLNTPVRSLCNLTTLRTLNLAQNRFVGTIATCLGNLEELRELNLSGNLLSGEIPSGFVQGTTFLAERKGAARLTALGKLQSLNLSNNQLSGAVPLEFTTLIVLRVLRLSQNRLTALPNFTALRLDTVSVSNNALLFSHLEQFTQTSVQRFEYAPQDTVGTASTLTRLQGDSLILTAVGATANSRIEWFRNGVSLGAPLTGGTGGSTLRIASVRLSDAGLYSYRITHPILTALTLVSRQIAVQVQPRPAMPEDMTQFAEFLLPPRLLFPQTNSRNIPLRPVLKWSRVANALRYEVEIRNASSNLTSLPLERLIVENDTTQRLSNNLSLESRFQWRVRAIFPRNGSTLTDTTAWSENGLFTTVQRNSGLAISTFNFGKVLIDEIARGEVSVTNTGETSLQLRSLKTLTGDIEFKVSDDVANVRLQPGNAVTFSVSYQPIDTVGRKAALEVQYDDGSESKKLQIPNVLEGRGVPLEIRPLNFDTVLVERTFLASAQVINRSVHNLSLDSLVILASNAASEGVFTVDRAALVQSGRLFLGSGDTTSILVRCRALRPGRFTASLRLASARIDTLEIPIVAVARERLTTDIIAKIGIRSEPASAKPGDTVRLRLFLAEGEAKSLFATTDIRRNFSARIRFDKYVLALTNEQGGKARSIVNTDPRNRTWRVELNARAIEPVRNEDYLAEHTIPCVVLQADVDRTALVVEDFFLVDKPQSRKYFFENAATSEFVLRVPRANASPRLFAVDTLNKPLPTVQLQAISPNPAGETLELSYSLGIEAPLSIILYSSDGRNLATVLESENHTAGTFRLVHRISSLPSGAYLVVLKTPKERITQRLEVIR